MTVRSRFLLLVAALTSAWVGAAPLYAQEDPTGGYENTYPDLDADATDILTGLTTATDGSPILFVDVFKAMGNEKVKEASWVFKIPVAAVEAVKSVPKDVASKPWQWVTAGLVAWEVYDSGVSDLFSSSSSGDGGRDIRIEGDGNQVRDISPYATISVKGSGNTVDANTKVEPVTGLGP